MEGEGEGSSAKGLRKICTVPSPQPIATPCNGPDEASELWLSVGLVQDVIHRASAAEHARSTRHLQLEAAATWAGLLGFTPPQNVIGTIKDLESMIEPRQAREIWDVSRSNESQSLKDALRQSS